MTDKTDKKTAPPVVNDETRSLGKPADPKVKAQRPQVADAKKLNLAIGSIEDLDKRLAQLDQASGPFGSDDVDFRAGKLDALIDDDASDEVSETAADTESAVLEDFAAADTVDIDTPDQPEESVDSLDDLLGNELAQDEAAKGESEETPAVPAERAEVDDEEHSASIDAFLSEMEDEDFASDESYIDPIDDQVELDDADEEEAQPRGKSPFAALFTPVNDDIEFDDPDFDNEVDEFDDQQDVDLSDYADDEALFFGEDDLDMLDDDEGRAPVTLPGADGFDVDPEEEVAEFDEEDIQGSAAQDEDPGAGLPELTMGVDDDIYAPGTAYADEEETHSSEDDDFADFADLGGGTDDRQTHIEKDEDMANPVKGSGEEDTSPEALDRDDENTFAADDIDAFEEDEISAGEALGEGFDEAELDAFLEEDEDGTLEAADTDNASDDEAEDQGQDALHSIFEADEDDDADAGADVTEAAKGDAEAADGAEGVPSAEEETPEETASDAPAKKGKGKFLMAASVIVLGGVIGGYAGMNGMIPGVDPDKIASFATAPSEKQKNSIKFGELKPIEEEVTSEGEIEVLAERDVDEVDPILPVPEDNVAEADPIDVDVAVVDPVEGDVLVVDMPEEADKPEDIEIAALDEPETPLDVATDDADAAEAEDVLDTEANVAASEDDASTSDVAENEAAEGEAEAVTEVVAEAAETEGDATEDTETPADTDEPREISLSELMGVEKDPNAEDADKSKEEAEIHDPISELAAQIGKTGEVEVIAETEEPEKKPASVFVEEERVADIEDDVTSMGLKMDTLIDEISQMNTLMVQTMERSSKLAARVESNERSLRGVTAILSEFSKVSEGLDQTQIVLLDIAARVGSLEASNPADADQVNQAISDLEGEIKRLTANMAILARMTVNGVSALEADGASAGAHGVQTSRSELPSQGADTVFAQSGNKAKPSAAAQANVPSDAAPGDFVEGYGYVLDVVPASGDQKLVIMENASVLVPK